jgi:hypothetical protein
MLSEIFDNARHSKEPLPAFIPRQIWYNRAADVVVMNYSKEEFDDKFMQSSFEADNVKNVLA